MTDAPKIILALVLLLGSAAPAEGHPPYSAGVRHAREWLRARTTARAFLCAHILWDRESHWNVRAGTPSGAYGIPQAYPGRRMDSAGDDWRWNATTQVKWGRNYVKHRYGTFCRALRFQDAHGWY